MGCPVEVMPKPSVPSSDIASHSLEPAYVRGFVLDNPEPAYVHLDSKKWLDLPKSSKACLNSPTLMEDRAAMATTLGASLLWQELAMEAYTKRSSHSFPMADSGVKCALAK